MKRFHVNVGVSDINASTDFYTTLFGAAPSLVRDDYVKWLLDDPALNFSLSAGSAEKGVNHLGLQVDSQADLSLIQSRLEAAAQHTVNQPAAECCYAASSKTWVRDPDAIAWESFVTHGEITHYGNSDVPVAGNPDASAERCCGPADNTACCI